MDLQENRRVIDKIRKFNKYITDHNGVATIPRGIILNYSNACNFHCDQCFTESPTCPTKGILSKEILADLADQADQLGMYEILIEGGEPLICKDLYEIIQIFGAHRFYMAMTTNGYLLTPEVAKRLKDAGMSRVVISLDSTKPEVHDSYRGMKGAYEHALLALENVKNAGMQPSVNFLVGHYNIDSGEIEEVCDFCEEQGYQMGLVVATPTGNWRGKYEVMLTEEDTRYLESLRGKYRNIWRDIWPPFANKKVDVSGCIAVNRPYINPYGDVMPCSYLHMKLGNILEQPLKEILEKGFSYECFRCNHKICYAGEDVDFAKKYLSKEMSILKPIPIEEIF